MIIVTLITVYNMISVVAFHCMSQHVGDDHHQIIQLTIIANSSE